VAVATKLEELSGMFEPLELNAIATMKGFQTLLQIA
jgi:hypothetical protein